MIDLPAIRERLKWVDYPQTEADIRALCAEVERLHCALLTERGKVERADADNERLQGQLAEVVDLTGDCDCVPCQRIRACVLQ